MDSHQHQKIREKTPGLYEEKRESQASNKQKLPITTTSTPTSPPSKSSSPSHEFSFTISLHSSSQSPLSHKPNTPVPPFAMDLSPADDIFFHGHLLPLHLLSHLPVSPRASTQSHDQTFGLPIRRLLDDDQESITEPPNCISGKTHNIINTETREKTNKFKSLSLFGLKWRKGCDFEVSDQQNKEKNKRKLGFDISHVLKRYAKMVQPLLFNFRGRREEKMHFRRQGYSFSAGNISLRKSKEEMRGINRRGEFSAPASMNTSPTNSGLLVSNGFTIPSSTSDSSMEELQAAIQAAIAHCKNSFTKDDQSQMF